MNNNVWVVSLLVGVLSIVGAITFNSYTTIKSMEKNIETAVNKGIDPIAVRCAYSTSSNMCIAYAATAKK